MNRRIQTLLLLLVVVCVPAATRATQHLNYHPLSQESSGFSKSSASAPEKARLVPAVIVVRVLEATDTDARQPGACVPPELSLTLSPVDFSPDSLRAPPRSSLT
jgi:hypothetical protein